MMVSPVTMPRYCVNLAAAEYTPPVIYRRENRSGSVFMIEVTLICPQTAATLHPGQPVDVELGS